MHIELHQTELFSQHIDKFKLNCKAALDHSVN